MITATASLRIHRKSLFGIFFLPERCKGPEPRMISGRAGL